MVNSSIRSRKKCCFCFCHTSATHTGLPYWWLGSEWSRDIHPGERPLGAMTGTETKEGARKGRELLEAQSASQRTAHSVRQPGTQQRGRSRKGRALCTLRAPLSGTFLQTLPDLVTPLKGHSLSPRSCPPTRSAPSERFRY